MDLLACLICYSFSAAMLVAMAWSFVPIRVSSGSACQYMQAYLCQWVAPQPEITQRLTTTENERLDKQYAESLWIIRQDVFRCPCGKSYRQAAKYHAHQDKCWAWGHYDGLKLTRNKLGGLQAKGDRFVIPKNGKSSSTTHNNGKNACPAPTMPSYSGDWVQHTAPICGKEWVNWYKETALDRYIDPELSITFDASEATRPISMTDLAELYPKMVRNFGGLIKVTQ